MKEVYVEFTREQLLGSKEEFETKATKYISDHRNRGISTFVRPAQTKRFLGLSIDIKGVSFDEAARLFEESDVARCTLGAVTMGINRLREVILTASKAPIGTKFLVPSDDARWFLP